MLWDRAGTFQEAGGAGEDEGSGLDGKIINKLCFK